MQKKYSLFELASELNEEKGFCCNESNTKNIKRKVFEQIQNIEVVNGSTTGSYGFFKKTSVLIAVVILISAMSVSMVVAADFFGVRLFNKAEQDNLKNPKYVTIYSERLSDNERCAYGKSADILDSHYFETDSDFSFSCAGTIAGNEINNSIKIPDFIFDNGELVIFTDKNGNGVKLLKNEIVSINFEQNVKDNPRASKSGSKMEVGVIINAIPFPITNADSVLANIKYTADADGDYYFYVKNYSSDEIVVENVTIEKLLN